MKNEIEIKGFCEPQFKKVEDQFRKNFENQKEVGASCAVTMNGKFVVDLWAGFADEQKTKPWSKDTIVNVWSSTKIMTALCIHLLVDRGLLDVEEPVATYWPEFNQKGKEKVLVRHLLRHSSGLFTWDVAFGRKDQCNWNKAVSLLESQKPRHEPGTRWIYHAVTFGFLLGHLVKKITGKSIGTFFNEEIASKVNADFYIGLPEQHDKRVADLIPPVPLKGDQSQEDYKKARKLLNFSIEFTKTREWRVSEIPGSNGHGNARSMARVGSIIACSGTLDGVKIISEETLQQAMQKRTFESDFFPDGKFNFGLGWLLPEIIKKDGKIYKNLASWGGWGGSNITMDLDNKICFAYAMNRMINSLTGDSRSFKLSRALYNSL